MSIDVNTLSVRELDQLIAQAKKRKTTLSKRKPIALVRKKLTQLAKAEGYTVAELSVPAERRASNHDRHESQQQGQGQVHGQGGAEIPESRRSVADLGRSRSAAEMARSGNRQGSGAGRIPDQIGVACERLRMAGP